jgi:hypothetical protein
VIRAATTGDLPRLFELVMDVHARSSFRERGIEPSPTIVRSTMLEGVRKHGGQHAGSTLVNVIEYRDRVEAFMYGLLQPIYGLGIGLEAQDFLLTTSAKAPKLAPALLIDAYLTWALACEKVRDIYLSWTDVAGVDGSKIARLYQRKGFQRCGEIWKRGAR